MTWTWQWQSPHFLLADPFPFFFLCLYIVFSFFFVLILYTPAHLLPLVSTIRQSVTIITHTPPSIPFIFHSHFFFVSFLFQLSFSLFLLVYHFPHSFLSPSLSLSLFFLFLFLFFYSAMHDNIGRRRCYCTPFFVPLKQTKPPNRNSCKLLNSPSPISKYFLSFFSYFFFYLRTL